MSEFKTLSEFIGEAGYYKEDTKIIDIDFIKEFIRLLKDFIPIEMYPHMHKYIDKLAGLDLIEEKKDE